MLYLFEFIAMVTFFTSIETFHIILSSLQIADCMPISLLSMYSFFSQSLIYLPAICIKFIFDHFSEQLYLSVVLVLLFRRMTVFLGNSDCLIIDSLNVVIHRLSHFQICNDMLYVLSFDSLTQLILSFVINIEGIPIQVLSNFVK